MPADCAREVGVIVMPHSLHNANFMSNHFVCFLHNDKKTPHLHNDYMARSARSTRNYHWYINEWLAHYNLSQADVVRKTGWTKTKLSHLCNRKQDFSSDVLDTLARALNIRAYELLMHPDEASAIKRIRQEALRIASESPSASTKSENVDPKSVVNG